jgi:hypothetical protein
MYVRMRKLYGEEEKETSLHFWIGVARGDSPIVAKSRFLAVS